MMRKILTIAVLLPLASACAPFAASSAPALTTGQTAFVQNICDRVMGLKSSGLYRSQCEESLSRSLARKLQATEMAASYDACGSKGLANGSPAFAACVLDRQDKGMAAAMTPASLSYDVHGTESAGSYFDVPPSARWRREQYSCGQLGLMPGGAAFGQCVASLDADLFNPD
jgi:hypothetical protein